MCAHACVRAAQQRGRPCRRVAAVGLGDLLVTGARQVWVCLAAGGSACLGAVCPGAAEVSQAGGLRPDRRRWGQMPACNGLLRPAREVAPGLFRCSQPLPASDKHIHTLTQAPELSLGLKRTPAPVCCRVLQLRRCTHRLHHHRHRHQHPPPCGQHPLTLSAGPAWPGAAAPAAMAGFEMITANMKDGFLGQRSSGGVEERGSRWAERVEEQAWRDDGACVGGRPFRRPLVEPPSALHLARRGGCPGPQGGPPVDRRLQQLVPVRDAGGHQAEPGAAAPGLGGAAAVAVTAQQRMGLVM